MISDTQRGKVWLDEVVKPRCSSLNWLASNTELDREDLHAWFSWQRRKTPDTAQLDAIAAVAEADMPAFVRSATHFRSFGQR